MTVFDVSGGQTGGAARYRNEVKVWLARNPTADVLLIGDGRRVTAAWLLQRELIERSDRRVSVNNVSFVGGSGRRVVVLRNPLHFLRPEDADSVPSVPKRVRQQTPVIRLAARRADVVVVPSQGMADRVLATLPSLRSKLVVRHHPLTVRRPEVLPPTEPFVLYPSIPAQHKDLAGGIRRLLTSLRDLKVNGCPLRIKITAEQSRAGGVINDPSVEFIGRQPIEAMEVLLSTATAIYVPYTVESFGYPLAEARAFGVPVIAADSAQNREIAGPAFVPFLRDQDDDSLSHALRTALEMDRPAPDPAPFDANAYFTWITSL